MNTGNMQKCEISISHGLKCSFSSCVMYSNLIELLQSVWHAYINGSKSSLFGCSFRFHLFHLCFQLNNVLVNGVLRYHICHHQPHAVIHGQLCFYYFQVPHCFPLNVTMYSNYLLSKRSYAWLPMMLVVLFSFSVCFASLQTFNLKSALNSSMVSPRHFCRVFVDLKLPHKSALHVSGGDPLSE